MKSRIAIIGYGNIGKAVEQAVMAAEDMQLAGIYHHNDNLESIDADVAALCTPTREVPAFAEKLLLADDYFVHDETHVIPVPSVDALNNVANCVHLERSGVSGDTHNQRFEFNMTINNPALTGQVLVAVARAAVRMRNEQRFGAYTMIEIPPIYMLLGDEEQLIRTLV